MADHDDRRTAGPDESIFELFGDPPPEPDPDLVGPVPVVGDAADPAPPTDPSPPTGEDQDPGVDDELTLPHWSEPPTGQVPRVLAADRPDEGRPWSNVSGPRWRGEEPAWAGAEDLTQVFGDEKGVAAPPPPPPAAAPPAGPPTPAEGGVGDDASAPSPTPDGEPDWLGSPPGEIPDHNVGDPATERNLGVAAAVGAAFAAIAALAFLDTATTMVLVVVVVGLCAVELFKAMTDGGLRPATLLGITGVVTLPLAAYARGEAAYPLVLFLLVAFGALWYLVGADHHRPVANLGVTLLGVSYLGGLAGFAALLLRFPNGIGMILAAVIATVANDIGAYGVGRTMGRHPMSRFSPAKTWEGYLGGLIASVLATFLIVGLIADGITPFGGTDGRLINAIWLGLVVGVVAPIGDLTESLIKRDLGLKDMSGFLPGHGGMLDRVDGLLFALPATYYLARILGLSLTIVAGATTVAVAGSTGSIGVQTLEVIEAHPDRFRVTALGAGRSIEALAEQARRFRPELVVVADEAAARAVRDRLGSGPEVAVGPDGLEQLARSALVVVNGVVGFAGLPVTVAALAAGARLALANKESLIAAGPVVQRARRTPGAELIPVDSEHAAIHQCLRANDNPVRVARLQLTASGGPFRGRSQAGLAEVTIADALAHPTWSMGPKITIDSSTLMNKGLEVIEAHELFGVPAGEAGFGLGLDDIDVVVHPQSLVHSMVTYADGSTIAQLSEPTMKLPIGYALCFPDRLPTAHGAIDWSTAGRLDFEPPDLGAFPCLGLAYEAGRQGGTAPAWLSAANEVAVEAFLDGAIRWIDIAAVVADALDAHDGGTAETLDDVLDADRRARALARRRIGR